MIIFKYEIFIQNYCSVNIFRKIVNVGTIVQEFLIIFMCYLLQKVTKKYL